MVVKPIIDQIDNGYVLKIIFERLGPSLLQPHPPGPTPALSEGLDL